jgi:hypothetical protein
VLLTNLSKKQEKAKNMGTLSINKRIDVKDLNAKKTETSINKNIALANMS